MTKFSFEKLWLEPEYKYRPLGWLKQWSDNFVVDPFIHLFVFLLNFFLREFALPTRWSFSLTPTKGGISKKFGHFIKKPFLHHFIKRSSLFVLTP